MHFAFVPREQIKKIYSQTLSFIRSLSDIFSIFIVVIETQALLNLRLL